MLNASKDVRFMKFYLHLQMFLSQQSRSFNLTSSVHKLVSKTHQPCLNIHLQTSGAEFCGKDGDEVFFHVGVASQ